MAMVSSSAHLLSSIFFPQLIHHRPSPSSNLYGLYLEDDGGADEVAVTDSEDLRRLVGDEEDYCLVTGLRLQRWQSPRIDRCFKIIGPRR
ncbi:hypothetical protein DVH24_030484 [Malus domestica]|uniref:Uncharacterized protein n=1 Tax=Malus domestica TaxID=3750 RepID=A0A498K115_MALDO|nr:hypothetical protein DVH24_030484 [Malus domestica]